MSMQVICANPISDLLSRYEVNPTVCLAIVYGVIVIHIPECKVIFRASPSVLTIITALIETSENRHGELGATYSLSSIRESLGLLLESKIVIPKGTGNRIVVSWRDWG